MNAKRVPAILPEKDLFWASTGHLQQSRRRQPVLLLLSGKKLFIGFICSRMSGKRASEVALLGNQIRERQGVIHEKPFLLCV
jgi:hypothetical protein